MHLHDYGYESVLVAFKMTLLIDGSSQMLTIAAAEYCN